MFHTFLLLTEFVLEGNLFANDNPNPFPNIAPTAQSVLYITNIQNVGGGEQRGVIRYELNNVILQLQVVCPCVVDALPLHRPR